MNLPDFLLVSSLRGFIGESVVIHDFVFDRLQKILFHLFYHLEKNDAIEFLNHEDSYVINSYLVSEVRDNYHSCLLTVMRFITECFCKNLRGNSSLELFDFYNKTSKNEALYTLCIKYCLHIVPLIQLFNDQPRKLVSMNKIIQCINITIDSRYIKIIHAAVNHILRLFPTDEWINPYFSTNHEFTFEGKTYQECVIEEVVKVILYDLSDVSTSLTLIDNLEYNDYSHISELFSIHMPPRIEELNFLF